MDKETHTRWILFPLKWKAPLTRMSRTFPKWTCFQLVHLFHIPTVFEKFHGHFWCQFIIWSHLLRAGNFFLKSFWNKLHVQNKPIPDQQRQFLADCVLSVCLKECCLKPGTYFSQKHYKWLLSSKVSALRPCGLWSNWTVEPYYSYCFVVI